MGLVVHSIETFGTHDGPGIRLVVFTQGCLMRCQYCQNPDTQPVHSDKSKVYTAENILELLNKEKNYFGLNGGVTFSGGEPTLQAKELLLILKKIKASNFHVSLDTCGAIYSETVNELYNYTDLVMLDVKHINEQIHKQLTGLSNVNVLKNALYREESGKDMWLRYVLVPTITDQEDYLHQWARHFSNYKTIKKVQILPFHTLGAHKYAELGRINPLENVPSCTLEQAHFAKKIYDQYFENVEID